uniref:Uncharacterized protein n=1 Tax=Trichuris muris TaxID=70415 RepID=A0A5S6QDE0_TRIMR
MHHSENPIHEIHSVLDAGMEQGILLSFFIMASLFSLPFFTVLGNAEPIPQDKTEIIFLEEFAPYLGIQMAREIRHGPDFQGTLEGLLREDLRGYNYRGGFGNKQRIAANRPPNSGSWDEIMLRAYGLWDPIEEMIHEKTEHLILQG